MGITKIWENLRQFRIFRLYGTYFNFMFRRDRTIRHQTEKLKPYYSEDNAMVNCSGKTVIFMVDGKVLHGGLSDRIRGLIFSYMASRELGVDFRVNFVSPFRLDNYLEPKEYDWRISKSDISYNSNEAEPIYIFSAFDKEFESKIKFNYLKQRIIDSDKKQIHLYTNLIYHYGGKYTESFNDILAPTKIVQDAVDFHTQNLGGKYIDVTLRFQNLLGDFAELKRNKPLPPDKQQELIESCKEQVVKLHEKHPDTTILVTSDSKKFLNVVDNLDFTYIIIGDLIHMSFTSDNSLELHKKAFVDYLMIAGAEKIYLLCTGDMYQSGFPYTASLIYNKPFEVIKF